MPAIIELRSHCLGCDRFDIDWHYLPNGFGDRRSEQDTTVVTCSHIDVCRYVTTSQPSISDVLAAMGKEES